MVYDCGSCMAKYILCGFNFLIFLAGSAVLSIGIWLAVDKNSFIALSKIVPSENVQDFTQPGVIDQISYVLIAIGAFMFFISFLGYCGALRESQCMLTTYGILLLIILVLEIAAGCLAVIYKSKAEQETKNILKSSLEKYYTGADNSDAIVVAWDQLQRNLHCCGVENYTDYQKNPNWTQGDKIVPESCCIFDDNHQPVDPACTNNPSQTNSYSMKGCYNEVINWIMMHLNIVIITATVVGIIEILGVFFAFCLAKSINNYSK